jgi:hypothetical protein
VVDGALIPVLRRVRWRNAGRRFVRRLPDPVASPTTPAPSGRRLTDRRSMPAGLPGAGQVDPTPTFGVAVLGSLLNSAYRDRLHLAGLPAPVGQAIRDNVASGIAVAGQFGSEMLAAMVRSAGAPEGRP